MRSTLALALAALGLGACAAQPYPPIGGPPVEQPAALQGSWSVMAVNGRATPRSDAYFMRFDNGRISAKFGCNGMGGTYRIDRGLLVVSDLAQTLIGCPEPSATFEQQGAAVLGLPMQMRWDGPSRLVLASGAGTIALAR